MFFPAEVDHYELIFSGVSHGTFEVVTAFVTMFIGTDLLLTISDIERGDRVRRTVRNRVVIAFAQFSFLFLFQNENCADRLLSFFCYLRIILNLGTVVELTRYLFGPLPQIVCKVYLLVGVVFTFAMYFVLLFYQGIQTNANIVLNVKGPKNICDLNFIRS